MGAPVQKQKNPEPLWKSKKVIAVFSALVLLLILYAGKDFFKKNPYPGVPKQAVIYFNQGNEALAKDSVEKALNLFLKATDLDGRFADAQAKMAEGYFRAGLIHKASGSSLMKEAMFQQSKVYLDKALSIDPANGYAHFVLGLRAQESNFMDVAIAEFEGAKSSGVNTFELHSLLGFLYNEKEEPGKSVAEYEKANQLRPGDEKTLFNLGELSFGLDHYGEAAQYYGELIKINDKEKQYKVNYAAAVWKKGDEAKGKELFNQILNTGTDKFRNYNAVAWALIDKDVDYEWGIKLAHATDEIKPRNLESIDILGWGYYKAKDYVQAVRYLNQSMQQQPSDEVKKRLDMARAKLEERQKK